MNRFSKSMALVAAGVLTAANAHAAFTLPVGAAVDMGPVEAVMALIAVGLLALWGIRKFVKTTNRS